MSFEESIVIVTRRRREKSRGKRVLIKPIRSKSLEARYNLVSDRPAERKNDPYIRPPPQSEAQIKKANKR